MNGISYYARVIRDVQGAQAASDRSSAADSPYDRVAAAPLGLEKKIGICRYSSRIGKTRPVFVASPDTGEQAQPTTR